MVKEREDFIKLLNAPIHATSNFDELAKEYSLIERDFEKKVYTAPLIGCGAGLILFASALVSNKIDADSYYLVIPSLWLFFLGVVCAIFGGIFYIWNLSAWGNENTERNNIQNIYKDIHPKIHKNKHTFIEYEMFSAVSKIQIDRAVTIMQRVKNLSKKGKICLFFARLFIVLSGFLFFLGVFIPLYNITFN